VSEQLVKSLLLTVLAAIIALLVGRFVAPSAGWMVFTLGSACR